MFETFAGIGAQHKAISNIDPSSKRFKVVGTSEWDARAILSYSSIHYSTDKRIDEILEKNNILTEKDIDKYLNERVFSLNSKSPAHVSSKPLDFKRALVASNIMNNNYPDITKLTGDELSSNNVDLLTYSFPCQGLSVANMGRDLGINPDSASTSNLVWQIKRILVEIKENKQKLPKYLLMENVTNLIGTKHIKWYYLWINFLESMGYKTRTVVLNGRDFGSLQKRKRVFAFSEHTGKPVRKFSKIDINKHSEAKLKEMILDNDLQEQIKKYGLKKNFLNDDLGREKRYWEIFNSSTIEEKKEAIPNNTPSRHRMAPTWIPNKDSFMGKPNKDLGSKNQDFWLGTLTTKQDRHPNIGMMKVDKRLIDPGKFDHRFVTTREAYMIMGFSSKDYDSTRTFRDKGFITKESLYRQAGNSIVVEVLEAIFNEIGDINGK